MCPRGPHARNRTPPKPHPEEPREARRLEGWATHELSPLHQARPRLRSRGRPLKKDKGVRVDPARRSAPQAERPAVGAAVCCCSFGRWPQDTPRVRTRGGAPSPQGSVPGRWAGLRQMRHRLTLKVAIQPRNDLSAGSRPCCHFLADWPRPLIVDSCVLNLNDFSAWPFEKSGLIGTPPERASLSILRRPNVQFFSDRHHHYGKPRCDSDSAATLPTDMRSSQYQRGGRGVAQNASNPSTQCNVGRTIIDLLLCSLGIRRGRQNSGRQRKQGSIRRNHERAVLPSTKCNALSLALLCHRQTSAH